MCLIIKANSPKDLDLNLMECAYENNSDGFGVMFYNNGKVHTHKIVPKTLRTYIKYGNNIEMLIPKLVFTSDLQQQVILVEIYLTHFKSCVKARMERIEIYG